MTTNPIETQQVLNLNEKAISNLKVIRRFTLFVSFLGFAFMALAMCLFITELFISHKLDTTEYFSQIFPLLSIPLLYFFPAYTLWKFTKYSKIAIYNNNSNDLGEAFRVLKLHSIYMGIVFLAILLVFIPELLKFWKGTVAFIFD